MTKFLFRFFSTSIIVLCFVGCIKHFSLSDVSGRWLSVHEEWTVIKGDEEVKESYDYGDTPNEQSAYLRLASSAFDILAGTTSSSVDLVYYDRFSPINLKTQSRVLT